MATTPVQRGTALLYPGVAPTTTKLLIKGSTFRRGTIYKKVSEVEDNNAETSTYVFQNPVDQVKFEASTIAGQTAPSQSDLITLTYTGPTAVEYVITEIVDLGGRGETEFASYTCEKPVVDLSPA